MPLSWNEIRNRAILFSKEWAGAKREAGERQTFWNEFFQVFGMRRRTVATFEEPVKKLSGDWGFIDLFWPSHLLVEHKSLGGNLDKAEAQGMDYIRALHDSGRERDVPRWLIVSDFARIAVHDLEPEQDPKAPLFNRLPPSVEFPLANLHRYIHHFAFIAGYTYHKVRADDPANFEATQLMCDLHDALQEGGYTGHGLKRFLVRILFCLFAEDNGIFPPKAFELFLRDRTAEDGSDLGVRLEQLFYVLNTAPAQRHKDLDEELRQLPWVNGELFAERLDFADFNSDMRKRLLGCCCFRWDTISPAIFGSLFQAVMDSKERRQIGAHYTAEKNILKLIHALFLDELRAEFESIKADRSTRRVARLQEFHARLAELRFFDPACGCGNFLVLTYRELRNLELEILVELFGPQRRLSLDEVYRLSKLNVDHFYGIEIEEFPARIAEVALWLTDHQANMTLSQQFGQFYDRLPLRASPHIRVGNALHLDWREVLPPAECSYILGNPPFVGKKEQNSVQKADMDLILGQVKGAGVLDYVCAWYMKAAEYIRTCPIRVAFVSTNSITQGEQVGIIWKELLERYHVEIQFAHRTFPWESEARGKAHVHVVIIGFGTPSADRKTIFEYPDPKGEPQATPAKNINPYLADAPNVLLTRQTKQIAGGPEISYGSMANDKRKTDKGLGNLILDAEARKALLFQCPQIAPFIRPFMGSEEFLSGMERWCLWLVDAPPELIRECPPVRDRIEAVRRARSESNRRETRELARTPALFGEIRQPKGTYLLIPKVSSMGRNYMPIDFVQPNVIANGSALIIAQARLYHFGVLSSAMHMAWMRYTCGRMKSDYQYSSQIVYNNYPWPKSATDKQSRTVGQAAQMVLDARAKYPATNLADLYDPLIMPGPLLKAHRALDRAVDRCYRKEPFLSDRNRVEYLFALYEKIATPLLPSGKSKKKRSTEQESGDATRNARPK